MSALLVDVRNFERAETQRMFNDLQAVAGGTNIFGHLRAPTPIDSQSVIRMNRDTLYSFCVIDAAQGATVTIPDAGTRYLSVMVVDEDHYVLDVLHEAGEHVLAPSPDGGFQILVTRILVDPADPADLEVVNTLQDQLRVTAPTARAFEMPDYETESFDAVRKAVLALGAGMSNFENAFGSRTEVDPVMHLIGTAAGWGGLPESEAHYASIDPGLPVGTYRLTMRDVPVDAFWSISVYNRAGFFEENDLGRYNVNSITAVPDADGSVSVHLGGCTDGRTNCLPLPDGWNAVVRFYRPRPALRDGSWTMPTIEAIA